MRCVGRNVETIGGPGCTDSLNLQNLSRPIRRSIRWLKAKPKAYTIGTLLIVLAILLFATSIRSEIRVIDDAITLGEAPPGVHERDVPFNRTTLFRVSLTIGSCVVDFYLLDDQQYDIYTRSGTLPPPTIDCSRPERLLN